MSIKLRTGVDNFDTYEWFEELIKFIIENSPCTTFYVHGRKCWLNGVNPKFNRCVPELKYEYVYRIKIRFPWIKFVLNGGLKGVKDLDKLWVINFSGVNNGICSELNSELNSCGEDKSNKENENRIYKENKINRDLYYVDENRIYKENRINKNSSYVDENRINKDVCTNENINTISNDNIIKKTT
ncbi:trna-dihydrouridine synthase a [Vairimorpha apis BRL 01]|uniref:Trna-dihydrouridine synthase a n=1 Tax=Vairimorpha apis BRL 01 TaxID=1037528 RepID=T0MBL2_9MICR|nr:trna-dihydrouridine synthase a [Vairimorpha apis BRL 01]